MLGTAVRYENIVDRVSLSDKALDKHLAYLNEAGYEVVAVHAIGTTFYIFAKRTREQ